MDSARRLVGANGRADWSDPHLRDVAAFIRERTGLVFSGSRIGSAEDAMRRTMSRFGIATTAELRRRVKAAADVREALVDALTIGESYFFREPKQLELVRKTLVAQAGDPARGGRPLRVWSAGCAAGEEPYTLAILLREANIARNAFVLGTDVAVGRLAAARRARYTRWALRGVSEERIAKYFEQQAKQFVLDPDVRRMVDCRTLNLVSDELPTPAGDVADMDVILCRNVLIYMELPTVAIVAARLLSALAPDGWLFLGASDPPLASLVECEAVSSSEGMAYRRVTSRSKAPDAEIHDTQQIHYPTPPRPVPISPVVVETIPIAAPEPPVLRDDFGARALAAYRAGEYESATTLARAAIEARNDEADAVVLVRALSNLGRMSDAAEACSAALERHRESAELAYLQSLILLQGGHFDAAAAAARRALYLDRSFVLAYLALGEAFVRAGNVGRARRAFQNAVDLLEVAPDDAELTGADGESPARFLRIGLSQLNALEPKAAAASRSAP
ncbi:MAG TPA: CheR family methyltransferase [Gemmatimonadaceae bacterium]|nr:CheR family methyltransferase [Gemmatimonadaceae bacterium]